MVCRGIISIIAFAFAFLADSSTSFSLRSYTTAKVSKTFLSSSSSLISFKAWNEFHHQQSFQHVPIMSTSKDIIRMMPATLDRTSTISTSTPTLAPPSVEKRQKSKSTPSKQRKSTGSEAWEVRIYNDGKNTREFVARCLVQIVGHSEFTAYQTMMQAHQNGMAVVGIYRYEVAEMYYGELTKNGIVCDFVPVDEEK